MFKDPRLKTIQNANTLDKVAAKLQGKLRNSGYGNLENAMVTVEIRQPTRPVLSIHGIKLGPLSYFSKKFFNAALGEALDEVLGKAPPGKSRD